MTGINLVRAMKARGVSKEQVEKELERLFDEDKIVVHRHDQPSALTENERADLPVVMGTPIAGVYTRGSAEKNVPPPVEEPQPESVPSPLTSEPSAKVSEAVGRGDVTARNELLLRHQDKIEDRVRSRLRRLGLSTDEADEIAQQVNLKLVEAVDRGGYNPEQGPFVNYLSRVASNAVTDMLRDRGRRRASSIGASDEPGEGIDVADTRASHEDNVETQESLGQMRGVLGGLEPQQQKIMSAMQQHGMNQAQAAQALGMNRATFNRHYLATLAEMRRRMGVVEEEEE